MIGNTDHVGTHGWGPSTERDAFTTSFQSCFPHNVRQTRTGAGILLEWDAPTDGHASSYEIYRFDEDGVAGADNNKDERYSIQAWPWPNTTDPQPPDNPDLAGRFGRCLEEYLLAGNLYSGCGVDTVAKEPIATTTDTSYFDPRGVVARAGARWRPQPDAGICATGHDTCLQQAQHFFVNAPSGEERQLIYSRGDEYGTLPGVYRYFVVAVDSGRNRDPYPWGARCGSGTVGPELSPCTNLLTYSPGQANMTVLRDSPDSFEVDFDLSDGSNPEYNLAIRQRETRQPFAHTVQHIEVDHWHDRVHWPSQVWDGGNWSADWSDGSWDGYSYLDVSMPGVDYGMW